MVATATNHYRQNNNSHHSGRYYSAAANDMMMASSSASAHQPQNQMMDEAENVASHDYQIMRIDANLPLEEFKTYFAEHYKTVHYDMEEAGSLYLPDAVRTIEIISGNKSEKKVFKNPQILSSYEQYALKDIIVESTAIDHTNYLIFMSIAGKCTYADQICHMNLDLVQHANLDQDEAGVSYLIAYERIVINTTAAAEVPVKKMQSVFNFGNRKNIKLNLANNHQTAVSHPVATKQQSHHQNNMYEDQQPRHFNPTISSNNHPSAVQASATMSDHEERFSLQSEPITQPKQQQKEKNYSSSRTGTVSVPLMTEQSATKKEEYVDRSSYSKYHGILGAQNKTVATSVISGIMNPSKASAELSDDGEQKMPKSEDKFQQRRKYNNNSSNYENSSRPSYRNGQRQDSNRQRNTTVFNELYVVNFDESVDQETLREKFSEFGEVKDLYIKTGKANNLFAHVKFTNNDDAKRALEQNDKLVINGKSLAIKYKTIFSDNNNSNRQGGMRSGDRRQFNNRRGPSGQNSPRKNNSSSPAAEGVNADKNEGDW